MASTPMLGYARGLPVEIVCLANSTKNHGRCVAGRAWNSTTKTAGDWLRPVSPRPTHEIVDSESQYYHDGNGQPSVLDIVRIPLLKPTPAGHQTENHEIDVRYSWMRVGRMEWKDALKLVEAPASLWGAGEESFHGRNDEVSPSNAANISTSLVLLRPKKLVVVVRDESRFAGGFDRKVRVEFEVGGIPYRLALTDPATEPTYKSMEKGEYDISGALLCASLTELFTKKNAVQHAFKLAAAIITENS